MLLKASGERTERGEPILFRGERAHACRCRASLLQYVLQVLLRYRFNSPSYERLNSAAASTTFAKSKGDGDSESQCCLGTPPNSRIRISPGTDAESRRRAMTDGFVGSAGRKSKAITQRPSPPRPSPSARSTVCSLGASGMRSQPASGTLRRCSLVDLQMCVHRLRSFALNPWRRASPAHAVITCDASRLVRRGGPRASVP